LSLVLILVCKEHVYDKALFEKVGFFYCQILKGRTTQSNKVETLRLTASLKQLKFMYHKALAVLLTCKSYNVNCLLNLVL
jgi:hypothetical protein